MRHSSEVKEALSKKLKADFEAWKKQGNKETEVPRGYGVDTVVGHATREGRERSHTMVMEKKRGAHARK